MAYSRLLPSKQAAPSGASSGQANGSSSHIKVVVRVRPPNEQERNGNYREVVRPIDKHMLVFDPKEESSPGFFHGRRRRGRDINRRANKDMRFAFDSVFDDQTSNEEIFLDTTRNILDGLLNGFNCSVFAYGATGAGKTFTMLGSRTSPGVIFLTMMELYRRMEAMKEEKTCEVAVSYLEVYNEQIKDLLMPGSSLPVHEHPQKGVIIKNLSLHKPKNAQELMYMLDFGNKNRTQHPTDANAESSRSHAVFQVFVRQRDRTAGLSADVRVAKITLVDLAGSERATVTTNRGARFREGANINRSLLALGNCINALAEGRSKNFVPYRNSKLTRLLKDSLGGNCHTVMIAAVSPSSMSFEDTYNTLKYANRAKNIKADLKQNVLNVDFHLAQYPKIVAELKQEVAELKVKIQAYEKGEKTVAVNRNPGVLRFQTSLTGVFRQRISIRKEGLELEWQERQLSHKIITKELNLSRQVTFLTDPAVLGQAKQRVSEATLRMSKRRDTIARRKVKVQERINQNDQSLNKLKDELPLAAGQDDFMKEFLSTKLHAYQLEMELRDRRKESKFLRLLCRKQERDAQASERLMQLLLTTVQQQLYLLKTNNLATSDILHNYDMISRQIAGDKEVIWADQTAIEGSGSEVSLINDKSCLSSPPASAHGIDALIHFPILSCTITTPGTPQRTSASIDAQHQAAFTPCPSNFAASHLPSATPLGLKDCVTKLNFTAGPLTPGLTPHNVHNVGNSISQTNCDPPVPCTVFAGRTPYEKVPPQTSTSSMSESGMPSPSSSSVRTSLPQLDALAGSCADCGKPGLQVQGKQQRQSCEPSPASSHNQTPHHIMDATYKISEVIEGICPLQPSPPDGASNPAPPAPRTVTKLKPVVLQIEGTNATSPVAPDVDQQISRVNSTTVTKSHTSENTTPPMSRVKRSMDFNDFPSPAGPLSFADVVRSPLRAAEEVIMSPRSPLMARDNLPAPPANRNASGKTGKQGSFRGTSLRRTQSMTASNKFVPAQSHTFVHPSLALPRRHSQYVKSEESTLSASLRKFGLPSIIESWKSSGSKAQGDVPNYMKPTKAAYRRQRNHRRSISAEANPRRKSMMPNPVIGRGVQRVESMNKENLMRPPTRIMNKSKSQSALQPPAKSTFF